MVSVLQLLVMDWCCGSRVSGMVEPVLSPRGHHVHSLVEGAGLVVGGHGGGAAVSESVSAVQRGSAVDLPREHVTVGDRRVVVDGTCKRER